MIDLHTHSTASDGRLSPTDLVARAAANGVTHLALTDHDTVAGVPEARSASRAHRIQLISGVEISATWQCRTLHIVGLGVDIENAMLAAGLSGQQNLRVHRARAMAGRLARYGLKDGYERARTAAGEGQITRAHFAALLVNDGLCRNTAQAFKRFLKPGKPAYQGADWAPLREVIDWIHAAGGTAVFAHPFGYRLSGSRRRAAVAAFAEAGGDGLEIGTGVSTIEQERQSVRDALAHGLAGSLGSDFHSPDQFWLAIGRLRSLDPRIECVIVSG